MCFWFEYIFWWNFWINCNCGIAFLIPILLNLTKKLNFIFELFMNKKRYFPYCIISLFKMSFIKFFIFDFIYSFQSFWNIKQKLSFLRIVVFLFLCSYIKWIYIILKIIKYMNNPNSIIANLLLLQLDRQIILMIWKLVLILQKININSLKIDW